MESLFFLYLTFTVLFLPLFFPSSSSSSSSFFFFILLFSGQPSRWLRNRFSSASTLTASTSPPAFWSLAPSSSSRNGLSTPPPWPSSWAPSSTLGCVCCLYSLQLLKINALITRLQSPRRSSSPMSSRSSSSRRRPSSPTTSPCTCFPPPRLSKLLQINR